MYWTSEVFTGIIGLAIGSFLNVCIYRIPRGESIVFPASHCPVCRMRLGARDLAPVISYLWLRGRCRSCGTPISARYPVVEALTGLGFFLAARYAHGTLELVKTTVLLSVLIVVFFVDLEHQLIPDRVVAPGALAGLVFAALQGRTALAEGLIGCGAGFAGFLVIAEVGTRLLRKEAMGGGDVKFAGMLGLWLGWRGLLVGMFVAFLAGSLVGLPLMLLGRKGAREPLPFGPMMCVGALAGYVWWQRLVEWYWELGARLWG